MQSLDIDILPEEARKLLLEFYEFLLKKYNIETHNNIEKVLAKEMKFNTKSWRIDKQKALKRILSEPIGILPEGYKFNREEVHER